MKNIFCLVITSVFFFSCESMPDLSGLLSDELTEGNIADGLKQALSKGTDRAVSTLSKKGGYGNNALYRLTVPEDIQKVAKTLRKMGLGSMVDSFENKMNDAAEEAVKQAGPVFIDAITAMTLDDARKILMGSDTAATDFFKVKTGKILKDKYLPIVKNRMSDIGLVSEFNKLMDRYNSIPFITKMDFTLENYVTDKALTGLFGMLAETEKDIRKNPVERTTSLLKRVFAEQDNKEKKK